MEAHEIVHHVMDHHRGLAVKLARITGKTAEYFASHGREPRTVNPMQSGNVSPVTHFIRYAHQFEAVEPGAGKLLVEKVCAELLAGFGFELPETDQTALELGFMKEFSEAMQALIGNRLEDCSRGELSKIESELVEARDKADEAIAHIRAIRRTKK